MTPMNPPDPTRRESAPGHSAVGAAQAAGLDAADPQLRRALKALPAEVSEADVDALASTVLQQWRERHAQGAATVAAGGGAATVLAQRLRRRWWLGTASLALVAVAATTFYVTRTDPSLEELMQPDVLSQMAIGEM